MRVVETQVFQYDELPEAAKATAREWWRGDCDDYPWHHENRQSLEAFCDAFPVKVCRWSYDQWDYNADCRFSWDDETPGDVLEGVRLRTYILNNYSKWLYKKATISNGSSKRESRIKTIETDCPFTGYHMDEVLLQPIREFIRAPKANVTFEDLLESCIDAWGSACRDDMAYYYSDESAEESIRANEYEFTEDGSIF